VAYREQTAPLIAYYKAHGMLRSVDGMAPIAEVARQIEGALDDAASTPKVASKPGIGRKSKAAKKRPPGRSKPAARKRPVAKARPKARLKAATKAGSRGKTKPRTGKAGLKAKALPKTRLQTRLRKRSR
jgi:hypothetical protein